MPIGMRLFFDRGGDVLCITLGLRMAARGFLPLHARAFSFGRLGGCLVPCRRLTWEAMVVHGSGFRSRFLCVFVALIGNHQRSAVPQGFTACLAMRPKALAGSAAQARGLAGFRAFGGRYGPDVKTQRQGC
jgi:hypothetical protein